MCGGTSNIRERIVSEFVPKLSEFKANLPKFPHLPSKLGLSTAGLGKSLLGAFSKFTKSEGAVPKICSKNLSKDFTSEKFPNGSEFSVGFRLSARSPALPAIFINFHGPMLGIRSSRICFLAIWCGVKCSVQWARFFCILEFRVNYFQPAEGRVWGVV